MDAVLPHVGDGAWANGAQARRVICKALAHGSAGQRAALAGRVAPRVVAWGVHGRGREAAAAALKWATPAQRAGMVERLLAFRGTAAAGVSPWTLRAVLRHGTPRQRRTCIDGVDVSLGMRPATVAAVLQHATLEQRGRVAARVVGQVSTWATHKHGSHHVCSALDHATPGDRARVVAAAADNAVAWAAHPHGRRVVRATLEHAGEGGAQGRDLAAVLALGDADGPCGPATLHQVPRAAPACS